jgi:hypothetical protein
VRGLLLASAFVFFFAAGCDSVSDPGTVSDPGYEYPPPGNDPPSIDLSGVTLSSVTADGQADTFAPTTKVTLTFDTEVEGLAEEHIEFEADFARVAKGTLVSKGSGVYELVVDALAEEENAGVAFAVTVSDGEDNSLSNSVTLYTWIEVANAIALAAIGTDATTLGGWYKQTANINLAGSWTPIGSAEATPFTGVYDGGDKVIIPSSVTITSSGSLSVGIFGYASGATFQNITVGTGSIAVSGTSGAAGAIAGDAVNSTQFINCSNAADLNSNPKISMGGICGYLNSSHIINCENTGDNIAGRYGGGICAGIRLQSTIKNSFNTGTVTVEYASSSIAGGGIAGFCNNSQIIACYNTGEIKGISSESEIALGGICGDSTAGSASGFAQITACYNTGKVWSNYQAEDDECIYIGGIAGYAGRYGVEITACYNIGIVTYTMTGEEDELGVGNISGWNTYWSGDTKKEPVITACYWKDIEDNPTNGIGYKETESGGAASDEGAIKFTDDTWPATTTNTAWGIGNKDGSANGHYWASLGNFGGNYPRLWFEK